MSYDVFYYFIFKNVEETTIPNKSRMKRWSMVMSRNTKNTKNTRRSQGPGVKNAAASYVPCCRYNPI